MKFVRHGPFDFGGGAWYFLEKRKILILIFTEKNSLAACALEKIIWLNVLPYEKKKLAKKFSI